MKNKKTYLTPMVKSVSFRVEQGFAGSGEENMQRVTKYSVQGTYTDGDDSYFGSGAFGGM